MKMTMQRGARASVLAYVVVMILPATRAAEAFRFGQAAVDITPPANMPFQVPQRPPFQVVPASGTHDPLQAKAVVFESGGVKAAIVACDLTSIPVHYITAAREQVAKISSVPPEIRCGTSSASKVMGKLTSSRVMTLGRL